MQLVRRLQQDERVSRVIRHNSVYRAIRTADIVFSDPSLFLRAIEQQSSLCFAVLHTRVLSTSQLFSPFVRICAVKIKTCNDTSIHVGEETRRFDTLISGILGNFA